MKNNLKYIALSLVLLTLSACASHPGSPGATSAGPALEVTTSSAPTAGGDAGNMTLTLQPKAAPAEPPASLPRRLVEGLVDVAVPILSIYSQTNSLVADTVVRAVVGTATATMAAQGAAERVVNNDQAETLKGLLAAASNTRDALEQAKGLNAMELIQHMSANYQGGQQIQSLVCNHANPRYRLALKGVSEGRAPSGWIDLGIDVEVPGSTQGQAGSSLPLIVMQEEFEQLCRTAAQQPAAGAEDIS